MRSAYEADKSRRDKVDILHIDKIHVRLKAAAPRDEERIKCPSINLIDVDFALSYRRLLSETARRNYGRI